MRNMLNIGRLKVISTTSNKEQVKELLKSNAKLYKRSCYLSNSAWDKISIVINYVIIQTDVNQIKEIGTNCFFMLFAKYCNGSTAVQRE